MTTGDRSQRIQEIFHEAAERPAGEREAFIREQCAGDQQLMDDVRQLLSHDVDEASGFLDSPIAALTAERDLHEGTVIAGRYRLKRLLGEGGMGAVYLAEQDQPKREVALKVIRWALASPSLLRRFEHEAELLGRLHHTGIAQVYDAGNAGTDSSPAPFFAMEHIDGPPLIEYVKDQGLDTTARLELAIRVCDAVQHAHSRGIIHRDLKPANILVDQSGQPKVLDFGVARVSDPDMRTPTLQTSKGQLVGTLPYMSPEQISGDPDDIDTRTDVYALGVILYQLLADRLPLALGDRSIADAARIIRDEEPTTLAHWKPEYRGDLALIVGKALEKQKDERYQSAAELAADVRRFLSDEPIVARPHSTAYQLRKFARRHRPLVAGFAVVMAALLLGSVGTTVGMVQAQEQRDEARLQARTVQAVNTFINEDLLGQADPDAQPDRDIKLSTVVDRAAQRLPGRFPDDPLVEAAIRMTLANTYEGLGRFEESEAQLLPAVDLFAQHRGAFDAETLRARTSLATILGKRGDAETEVAMHTEIREQRTSTLGARHPDTVNSIHSLAGAVSRIGDLERAVELYNEALNARIELHGPTDDRTIETMISLAAAYNDQARFDEGRRLLEEVVAHMKVTPGIDHPRTLHAMHNLAYTFSRTGEHEEAERRNREVYEHRREVLGDDHNDTLLSLNGLATALQDQGKLAQAEPLFKRALDTQSRIHGREHPITVIYISNYAALLMRQDKAVEAEPYLREAVELGGKAFAEGHFRMGFFQANLGNCLFKQQRYDEAEPFLLQGHGTFAGQFPENDPRVQHCVGLLIQLYQAWKKPEKVEEWQAKKIGGG